MHILIRSSLAALALSGCGRSLYELPPPPSERVEVVLNPAEERLALDAAYTDARRAVVGLYEAAGATDWARFYEGLSAETRASLDAASPSGSGVDALREGSLLVDGVATALRPVDAYLLPVPTRFSDTRDGVTDDESLSEKVVFVEAGAAFRRLVVVREGDTWRLHAPRVAQAPR